MVFLFFFFLPVPSGLMRCCENRLRERGGRKAWEGI